MADAKEATRPKRGKDRLVADYKRLLQGYIDRRPSGMRLKIAEALGKHKSFVSQITNPAYAIPVPARHLETIFRICHFSAEERETFLAAYAAAHPGRSHGLAATREQAPPTRVLEIEVPTLADPERQRRLEELIREVTRRIAEFAEDR